MKKFAVFGVLALVFAMVLSTGLAIADKGGDPSDNNGMPSGPHYNLNIIGVPVDKVVPTMTGSNRHTIFVPLGSDGEVSRKVKISYVPGVEFRVIDGNACDDNQAIIEVPSSLCGTLSFDVYARALGTPNGKAHVDAMVIFEDNTEGVLLDDSFDVERKKGQPKAISITDVFLASGWIDMGGDGGVYVPGTDVKFNNVWVFNVPTLEEYYWDYDNNQLKLLQIRFYGPTESGNWEGPCQDLLD